MDARESKAMEKRRKVAVSTMEDMSVLEYAASGQEQEAEEDD